MKIYRREIRASSETVGPGLQISWKIRIYRLQWRGVQTGSEAVADAVVEDQITLRSHGQNTWNKVRTIPSTGQIEVPHRGFGTCGTQSKIA